MCKLMAGVAPGETKNVWVFDSIEDSNTALEYYLGIQSGQLIKTADDEPLVVVNNWTKEYTLIVARSNGKTMLGASFTSFPIEYNQVRHPFVGKAVPYDEYLTVEGANIARALIAAKHFIAAEYTIHELEELSIGVEDLKQELAEAKAKVGYTSDDFDISEILCRMPEQEMQ